MDLQLFDLQIHLGIHLTLTQYLSWSLLKVLGKIRITSTKLMDKKSIDRQLPKVLTDNH